MNTRHAREIRKAIRAARNRFGPHRAERPYVFERGFGYVPTRSALFMAAYDRAGGNRPPTVPPPHRSATAPVQPRNQIGHGRHVAL
jgi:hypothetical protein